MKKFLFLLVFVCSFAQASITDLKLSTAQMFDVQWYVSGGRLYTSSFNYIYASINYATQTASAARLTSSQYNDINSVSGRYIGFFASTTNPGTYGMAVFNPDGTKYKTLNNTGSFRALANGAIFYNGNGMWGTLITTGAGYSLGSSANFAITADYPTNTQLQAYTPPSSTPLTAGQTAAPAAPSLCCGGSSTAFSASTTNVTMVNQFNQRTTADSKVLIEQIGNFNTTTIQQSGTKNNYVHVYTDGSTNTTNITQSGNASTQANYVDLNIQGNNNTTNITQTSTGGAKGAFVSETGNANNIKIQQKDAGNHYASVSVSGGNKTVDITQQGSAAHMTSVTLSGNPTSLNLTQSGSTQQYYSITHNCATVGGCAAITVTQGQ
jgi:hypothetical protein